MMCVRAMKEGPEGRGLRDALIRRMWEDVEQRMKELSVSIYSRNTTDTF